MHEFRLVNGGKKALITEYTPVPWGLHDFNITNGVGWIEDSIFREVDVASGAVNFEWHSIDYFLPDSHTTIPVAAKGRTHDTPLDYFHINSLDKNADGDYLVSARHMNMILKISGRDGHIIWELSTRNLSTFKPLDFEPFGQHHARWISVGPPTTSLKGVLTSSRRTHPTQSYLSSTTEPTVGRTQLPPL